MDSFKNIHVNHNINYQTKKLLQLMKTMLNDNFYDDSFKRVRCERSKCNKTLMAYYKYLRKIKFAEKKISKKERKKEINKITKAEEYKEYIQCIIDHCFTKYVNSQPSSKVLDRFSKIDDEYIKEYEKIISSLKKVKVDDKLIKKFNKSKHKELNTLSKKQIETLYKKFIKNFKEKLKVAKYKKKIRDKKNKVFKKYLPIYQKLLKENKKEEYLCHTMFTQYLNAA